MTLHRKRLFKLTLIFEGGLIIGALILGSVLGTPPLRQFVFEGEAVTLGVLATIPLLTGLWFQEHSGWRWSRSLNRSVRAIAARLFRRCTLVDLAIVSLLAGIGEEMFFRGVLQGALDDRLPAWVAITIASVAFGLAHPVSLAYGVIATMVGAYLGLLLVLTGNLLVPVLVHALYDFFALVYLVRMRRSSSPLS